MKKGIIIGLLTSVFMLSFASIAFAAVPTTVQTPATVETFGQLATVIDRVVNFIFTGLIIGAIIFVILAAFQFLTGGGDPEQLGQARSKIIWAAVAIAVGLAAKGLPTIFKAFLETGTST